MKERHEIRRKLDQLKGINAAVVGLGISNVPVVRFLRSLGASVTACDRKSARELGTTYQELEALGVGFQLGSTYLEDLTRFDLIVKTPGMRPDIPQIQAAVSNGAVLTSEIQLVFDLCPCKIIAVTGSDGKTTTTSLVAAMMQASGKTTHLGGNIGTPLIEEVLDYSADDLVVLELSSFQLMPMKQSPEYAVITNISPNHLDVHKSYGEYKNAKCNIFRYQDRNGVAVLNYDNRETSALADVVPGQAWFFSRQRELERGAFLADDTLYVADGNTVFPVCRKEEIKLLGEHNIENILAAALVSHLAGADSAAIAQVAASFKGVEHRLEFVREVNGIAFYNDSIASSPTRAIAGVRSFARPIVLIAGGSDKKVPFDRFAEEIVGKVKALVLLGATADKIMAAVEQVQKQNGKSLPVVRVDSLGEAVLRSYQLASPGDVVLLSPACASFDMFKNFEARGRQFKELVNSL